MPFWPFYMALTAGLLVWGWRQSAWEAPAIMLTGLILVRVVVYATSGAFVEVAMCALWLSVAAFMLYREHVVPGLFLTFSALTYPTLLIFGFKLEYMTLAPIIADAFAIMAMLSIGGGLYGMANSSSPDHYRTVGRQGAHQMGAAKSRGVVG